jgi:hypothetical protein
MAWLKRPRAASKLGLWAAGFAPGLGAFYIHPMSRYVQPRPYADPDAAARKLVEIANSIEAVQDGRIHVEKINAPFLYQLKSSPAEYGAGMKRAIENGWLKMHESGTFVRFTQAGADLFAGDLRIRRMVSHTPMSSPSIAPRKAALAGAILRNSRVPRALARTAAALDRP